MPEPLQPAEILHEDEAGQIIVGIHPTDRTVIMRIPGLSRISFSPTQARALSKLLTKKAKEAETYDGSDEPQRIE